MSVQGQLTAIKPGTIDDNERQGMRILVTTASKHSATVEIGDAIGRVLEIRGFAVQVGMADAAVPVNNCGGVEVGSAVCAGQCRKAARVLIEDRASALRSMPVWMFSSGSVEDPLLPEDDTVAVAELIEAVDPRRASRVRREERQE
jgi:menaquinone-dependent protoporphyrinogen oxidase